MEINNHRDHNELQRAVDGMSAWCAENGMTLSRQKCVVLKSGREELEYTIDDAVIPTASMNRDLGVLMSPSLNFEAHITQAVRSSLTLVDSISRCYIIKHPEVYTKLYSSIIVPKLLYCSPVWFPYLARLQALIGAVRKRFIRRISHRCGVDSKTVSIPELRHIAAENDRIALRALRKADLIPQLFDVRVNRNRRQVSVNPKTRALKDTVNNMFAWRISGEVHEGSISPTLFKPFAE